MADLILGLKTRDDLDGARLLLEKMFGSIGELSETKPSIGSSKPIVLPLLREILLPGVSDSPLLDSVKALPGVLYVAESRTAAFIGHFGQPKTLEGPVPALEWGLERIGIERTGFSGRGIKIAILDTGLDMSHPDFKDRPNTYFMDVRSQNDLSGHGTFVAGIIGGTRTPVKGPRYGVAPDASLFIANVTEQNGNTSNEMLMSAGLEWALSNQCDLVNISWEMDFNSQKPVSFLEAKGAAALRQGAVLVAAGGNGSDRQGSKIKPVAEPAHANSILAVGSIKKGDVVSNFSPQFDGIPGGEVDFVAPGEEIRSSWRLGPDNTLYSQSSFTSWATAMVTGIAALHRESGVPPNLLVSKLESSASQIAGDTRDIGHGVAVAP